MTQQKPTDGGSPGQPPALDADVMNDLETLGTAPGCVILSIGAVVFDPITGRMGAEFYRNIDRASCLAIGLTIDDDTAAWWREPSQEARDRLEVNPQPILEVLADFTAWWSDVGGRRFWGHGAGFDEPILRAAYKAAGLSAPWSFSRSRDTRTIYDLANVAPNRDVGVHHDALVDARNQAVAVCDAFRKLGLTAPVISESDGEIGIPPFGRAAPIHEPAPLTLATDLSSTKAESLETVTLADLPFPLDDINRAESIIVTDGEREVYLKDRNGNARAFFGYTQDFFARPGKAADTVLEFPYAIGSKVLERERQFRIAAGALVGGFVGIAALYLLFWLLPPAVGAVTIVAGWIPWAAAVGGLIMARRS